jgi:broad specificity phosphatase PhoE
VWFDPHLDFKGQKRRLRGLPSWLAQRPEQRVMIVTHNRVLRHLVGAHVGNGQYALARLCATGDLYTTPTIAPFVPRLLCENPDGRSGRRVLFVRHCQDETLPVVHNRAASARFLHWHDAAQRAADTEADGRRDPCLTELGIAAASTGIADSLRASMNAADGYGGVHGGLSKIMHSFAPELVVTSPLARAVQTALVAFDRTTVPVVVHPFIKELKKDYTFGGRFPDGKPGCAGSSWQQLRAAIERHPRSSGAPVDTSLLADDNQFDPLQSYEDQLANLRAFTHWLVKRPEKNIVVVSHGGVLRHLLHTELGHGQYVLTEPHVDKAAEPATKVHFTIVQFSSGVQPYFEN